MVDSAPAKNSPGSDIAHPEQKVFQTAAQLVEFVQHCATERAGLVPGSSRVLPPGSRSIDYFVKLDSGLVLEHSTPDQVISVESGIEIGRLARLLTENKQWLPIPAVYNSLTLMEVIDRGLAGALEHRFGGLRELVLGVDVLPSSGEVIKCGGKVVKNVTGYDLTKLFIGVQGWLGYVLSAHLRLFALPELSHTKVFSVPDIAAAYSLATRLMRTGLPMSCLELASPELLSKTIADVDSVCVCVQNHGPADLLNELDAAVSGIMSGIRETRIGQEDEAAVWDQLNEPADAQEPIVIIQGSMKCLIALVSRHGKEFPQWSLRPAANKLIVRSMQRGKAEAMLAAASELSSQMNTIIQAASNDEKFLWHISYLPQDDAGRRTLIDRIKKEFDPFSIFNPLVSI